MTKVRRRVKASGLAFLLAILSIGTISNQIRLNAQSARFRQQAEAGAKGLARQCQLVPAGVKIQRDALHRGVISADNFALYVSTAKQYCPNARLR